MALPTSETDMRALEPKCAERESADSVRTTTQLAALHVGTQRKFLYRFEKYDLYNLTRCVLDAELSPDTKTEDGKRTVLVQAALLGHARALKALLEGRADHSLSEGGLSALQAAAFCGKLDCLQLLLAFGADSNATMDDGYTTLMVAIYQKHDECVKALLPSSDPLAVNANGYRDLHLCARRGSEKSMAMLLQSGREVDAPTGASSDPPEPARCCTALHFACELGRPAMVKALLAAGASRMARDWRQCTPLHQAASSGKRRCAELLLQGASPDLVDAVDEEGFTALHLGALCGGLDVCTALLAAGARRDAKTLIGNTPLSFASAGEHEDREALLELLAEPPPAEEAPASPPPPPPPPEVQEAAAPSAPHALPREASTSPPPPPPPPPPANEADQRAVTQNSGAPATAASGPPPPPLLPTLEAELRALDAKCGDDAADEALTAAWQMMEALPAFAKKLKVERFVDLDLSNMLRILLAAGAPADAVFTKKGRAAPVLFHAALLGHANALSALLEGGANHGCVGDKGMTVLHAAVEGGHAACAQILLVAGADADAFDALQDTPLMAALRTGQDECARVLLPSSDLALSNNAGSNALNACAKYGSSEVLRLMIPRVLSDVDAQSALTSALRAAVDCGHIACVRLLLDAGADADSANDAGETLLQSVIFRDQVDLACALLPFADPSIMNDRGWNALHLATSEETSEEMFHLILSRSPDVDAPTLLDDGNQSGLTALHLACQRGHESKVEALLAYGASRVSLDSSQFTPLHFAASLGFPGCVARLLGPPGAHEMSVAEVNAPDGEGRTALIFAVLRDDADEERAAQCVRLLIAAGADTAATDARGSTALMIVVSTHRGLACAQALLPSSDLAATNRRGYTAFHLSVSEAVDEDWFEMLLPLVPDVDVRTVRGVDPKALFGSTALHIACANGRHTMVAALLARGASRKARDSSRSTPLAEAAGGGCLACVILLVGWPGEPEMTAAEVNSPVGKNLQTALHSAAEAGHVQLCGVLIAAGARLDANDLEFRTPYDLAWRHHPTNTELIALLSGKGPAEHPGTMCALCGLYTAAIFCPDCGNEVYCSAECMKAASMGHMATCMQLEYEDNDQLEL